MLSAQAIKNHHSDVFTFLQGNLSIEASHCHVPEEALRQSLVYVTDVTQLSEARRHKPAILIVHVNIADRICGDADQGSCCFSVRNISMGMAILLKYFDSKSCRFTQWGEHHPTAVVHRDATIGAGVFLGPYCVIGAGADIGDGCLIGSHCVVENQAKIGARSILHPQVFVGAACEIGEDCEIHPHTSIGSDGFGYAVGADGRPRKIAHLGNVKIGDGVEIGSNCAIDRATLTSTHIRSGSKLDNICHIAHNCDLGENGFFTAGFMMGGSTKIGRQFVTGGNSVVTAHITVGDNVVLSGRSSVTNDVPNAGAYGGYPLQPLKEALRTAVSIGHLNEIRRNLKRVMKHLHLSENPQSECAPQPVHGGDTSDS
ncbi:MAG TPA: UDP-3-O-(3-hydroxymyristoyl)glucosamine N-acyltransferase [Steroidobacteraceae bacterium]|jgi:UDP-3-O-[3-hydroxymyristoyl] glucosamine N-acyltransferase|nr:UDP-3-O-(3-hydroxymyristoyl)glucosamine N-acyltransferase [Steroidobacteraceae bacterium]